MTDIMGSLSFLWEQGDEPQEDRASLTAIAQAAEPVVFTGEIAVGQGEESLAAKFLDAVFKIGFGSRLADDVIEVIHRELCDTPLEAGTIFCR